MHALLLPHFEVLELFTVPPYANRGFKLIVNSHQLNRIVRVIAGDHFDRLKEHRGTGWTAPSPTTRPMITGKTA